MEFNYVKKYYNVPACLGRIVKVDGKSGVIVKDCGHYIGVNFDDDKPGFISNCHPTWNVEYLGIGSIRKSTKSQRKYQLYLEYGECFDNFLHFLQSDIEQLESEIKELEQAQPKWISVEDELPSTKNELWVYDGDEVFDDVFFVSGDFCEMVLDYDGDFSHYEKLYGMKVQCWMLKQVPQPPEVK